MAEVFLCQNKTPLLIGETTAVPSICKQDAKTAELTITQSHNNTRAVLTQLLLTGSG